jgi:chloride channel protein, CIC family
MKAWAQAIGGLGVAARVLFQRHWRSALRLREKLRPSEEAYVLVLAGGVGILGGVANLVFTFMAEHLKTLVLHQQGDLAEIALTLAPWQRLVIPIAGGWLAGLVLCGGARLRTDHRPGNFLEAVVAGDGRLPLRSSLVNTTSSLISISSGASIGREGLLTQLTAALASKWGQLRRWQPYRLRLLTTCGAAAGLAAAYNAPLAGAVFASQIVLGNFSMNFFAPVVFSSVLAAVFSRAFFGIQPWYTAPDFQFIHVTQLSWFIVLGLFSGMLGAAFMKLLRFSEAQFKRLPTRQCLRLAIGGLGVGLLALFFPQVWGNGYSVTNNLLTDPVPLQFILCLLLVKLVATVISIGSGAVGGVFTPTLFLGAALGCTLGTGLHLLGYAIALPTGVFAMVGMGSTLAATTHSPLLAIIMVFEISLNYSMMPPLMLACTVGSLVSSQLHRGSVYFDPVRAQRIALNRESPELGAAHRQTVGELMHEPIPPLRETDPLRVMAERFLSCTHNYLPVIDSQRQFKGLVSLHDLKEHLSAGAELDSIIAYDFLQPAPAVLTPDQPLIEVLPSLLKCEIRNIPVVNNLEDRRLVGSVVRSEALALLSAAIAVRTLPHSHTTG